MNREAALSPRRSLMRRVRAPIRPHYPVHIPTRSPATLDWSGFSQLGADPVTLKLLWSEFRPPALIQPAE
jgi:hypothetical protein